MANWLPLKSERRIRESPFSCFVCVSLPRERSSTSGRFYRQRKPVEFLRLAVQPTVEPVAKSESRKTCNREPKPYLDLGQRILPRSLSMNHRAPAKANSYPVQKREEPEQSRRAPFPIVGVGASAGGLEAFTQLLKALPSRTGMAYVLVQHLDPTHESALTELLARATEMPVRQVTDAMPVEPNRVYVIPPNVDMVISQDEKSAKYDGMPESAIAAGCVDLPLFASQ